MTFCRAAESTIKKVPNSQLNHEVMTGSIALDVVIGLVFIYLLYSLLATIVQEILATNILHLRAKILEKAIKRMLDDNDKEVKTDDFSKAFYLSPLIKYMAQNNSKKPSYLAARNFSKVILDILKGANPEPGDDFRSKIDDALTNGISLSETKKLVKGETLTYLRSVWAESHGDIEKFQNALEQWFNDTMERASGWYKKRTQIILFFVGLGIAITFNVDTVVIIHKLSNDPELREQLVRQADAYMKEHAALKEDLQSLRAQNAPDDTVKKATDELEALEKRNKTLMDEASKVVTNDISKTREVLALGWAGQEGAGVPQESIPSGEWFYQNILCRVPGWLLTAFALSLGAPFWFDLLNKLMNLRSGVQPAGATADGGKTSSGGKTITPKG